MLVIQLRFVNLVTLATCCWSFAFLGDPEMHGRGGALHILLQRMFAVECKFG